MKKSIKRIKSVAVILVVLIIVGMLPNSVSARVVNQYLYTDIIATIDGHEIRTFNIDGYTNVVAEDLVNYGFEVKWDERSRRLDISRCIYPTVTSNYKASRVSKNMVGRKAGDVLSTDIDTYVKGKYIKSYNIGGYTCVNIEDIAKILYCKCVYNDYERHLYVTRHSFPDFNSIRGVKWTGSISHLATYRDLDLKVSSANSNKVTFEYKLYNSYSNETISSGTLSVPYHPDFFKYSYQISSYEWFDEHRLGLVTDMFVIPDASGREFDKIRVVFGEDGMMYETSNSTYLNFTSMYELKRK